MSLGRGLCLTLLLVLLVLCPLVIHMTAADLVSLAEEGPIDATITCPKTLCVSRYTYWRGFARDALGALPPCMTCTFSYSSMLTPQEQLNGGSSVGIIHSAPTDNWALLNLTLTLHRVEPDSRVITIIAKETQRGALSKYITKRVLVKFETKTMTPNEFACP